ncbi:hypothetical protein UFOVP244_189 [uncultured Caudovirales phage]|uniref:Uncharacterized protein n=1 Tax=uncultured Caudovirales phage TaxID=2100421 RepID=A0A6J7WXH1_9CAUD|nr:hypothetical protein UFOVP244_189 [uncultured Caudovirales phage]
MKFDFWKAEGTPSKEAVADFAKSERGPLTAGDLKKAIEGQGVDCERFILGFGDEGGFDSFILGRSLIYFDGILCITGGTYYGHAAADATEVVFRDLPSKRIWRIDGEEGGGRKVSEALSLAPDNTPIYLALKRTGVKSRLGRHFLVPLCNISPLSTRSFTTEGGLGDYSVYPNWIISLWGEHFSAKPQEQP